MMSILVDEEDVEVDDGVLLMLVGEVNGGRMAGPATRRRSRRRSLELDGNSTTNYMMSEIGQDRVVSGKVGRQFEMYRASQAQTRNCPAIKPALEITPTVCNNVDLLNHSSPCRHRKRDGSATQTTSSHNSFIATVDLCESHAERLALMRGSWPIDPHLDANLVRDPHTREMGYGEDSTDLFSLEEIDAPHHQPRER
ncbi:hypothetical protein LWI28_002685 [Acer negundo]|uniref:Uncharacterized protein n=1 Tax=Acer negundo TaxID=4023 RepID=A0AAD5JD18_ACENE|nr:hypothetical protein LWI28_002685 [Acer negundo]